MGFRLREIDAESKFCREFSLDAIERVVPISQVRAVLSEVGVSEQRERKLNRVVTVFIVIGMGLYNHLSIGKVLKQLAKGLRYIWPEPDYAVAKDSAISYRRDQLGARPMVELFRRICRPLATEETPGAFLGGLRLMAIDGTTEDLADTPGNQAVFGRPSSGRGESAFPQMRGVYLVECGTHAIVDAGFWPLETGERTGGFRLLRALTPGMLVMWDRGFHDYDMIANARKQGAHVLSRLPAHVKPRPLLALPDQRLAQRPLRSQKPLAVIQEAYGLLIAHFVIRFLMHQAAVGAGIDPDRLSFTHALEVIRNAVDQFQMTAREQLDALYTRLLNDIAAGRLPLRRIRSNPRVVKRKMSKFLKKRPEHTHWPQPQLPWQEAIVLI